MRIDVAVCAAGAAPGLAQAVRALAAERPEPIVAVAGDLEPALDVPARVVRADGPGLAHARNAALAASDADVVAMVEDDVLVAPGWLAALERAWAAAPDAGAIGGPIAAHVEGERPRWLTDALLGAYGLLDYGDAPLALDPAQRTLLGGNCSWRADALRGVGGFWPARGHPAARDWFSEEHHAQRELAASGWSVRYEPAARAGRRIVPARDVIARRARYGARLGAIGHARTPAAAARQGASSLAGAAAALARADRARATERLARAAENAGVLAAERVARKQLAPVGRSPFRAQIPSGRPARERRRGGEPMALLYHRVAVSPPDPRGLCVSATHFAEHLEVLRARRRPRPLGDVLEAPADGDVAVTFDDGYADLLVAADMLALAHVPATIYISTGHVATGRPFFWDELERLLLRAPQTPERLTIALAGQARSWGTSTPEQRAAAFAHLHAWLQPQPGAAVDQALAQLRDWSEAAPAPDAPLLTVRELRRLAGTPGVTIGAHARDHVDLRFQAPDVVTHQVRGSREDLESWLGHPPDAFAYPFGVPGEDFDDATKAVVREAGFTSAVANAAGAIGRRTDRYSVPRLAVPDVDGDAFASWLGGG